MNELPLQIGVCRVCVLVLLLVCVSTGAKPSEEETAVLRSAFEKIANIHDGTCAYTQTVHEHEMFEDEVNETTVSRFDPVSRPDSPWEVLSVNGQAPTQRETKHVQSSGFGNPTMNFKLSTNGHSRETQEGGTGMADLPAWLEDMKVVSKEDDIWTFEVPISDLPQPPDESIKGFPKKIKMKMQLEVHASTSTLSAYRISLSKPIRFMLVLRVSELDFAMIFGSDPNVDGMVMKEMHMEMSGRALWKRISMKQRTTYTDFDCSGRDVATDDISQASSLY